MNKLHILTTYEQIAQLREYLRAEKQHVKSICAFDTEADGKRAHVNKVIGWSISIYEDEGFYIPYYTWTDEEQTCTENPEPIPREGENNEERLYQCISDKSIALANDMIANLKDWRTIMHNATYDVIIVERNFNISLLDSLYSDTMLKKHTVDSDKPHGLKECGEKFIGADAKDEQNDLKDSVIRNGGKWNKQDKWIWRGDLKYVGLYGAKDTVITLVLENRLDEPLDKLGLRSFYYDDLVMPLLKTSTIPMQQHGFPVDVKYFRKLKMELEAEIRRLNGQVYGEISDVTDELEQQVLDRDYQIRAGGRFGQALIEYVGLDIPVSPKTGKFSNAKAVLEAWSKEQLQDASVDQIPVIWYITGTCDKVPRELFYDVQRHLFEQDNPDSFSPVNLNSGPQFAEVVKEKWGIVSQKTSRKTGAVSYDAAAITQIAIGRIQEQFDLNQADAQEKFEEYMEMDKLPDEADWFVKFLRIRKLEKLLSVYVEGVLELEVDGVIYSNMNQAGTASGRYALNNPNLQQLPAHSQLGSMIKQGFVAERKHG
jgi:DNA polymerase I-like protein with 3'-5' exonuclease and polymerase domains